MKSFLKYIAIMALAILSTEAKAWVQMGHETIAALAEQNLTEKAKKATTDLLGGPLKSDCMWLNSLLKDEATKHTITWHNLHLNTKARSTTTAEGDAIVQIERCVNILSNPSQHSREEQATALKAIVHLVADMHCVHHVRIKGNTLTKGFKFTYPIGYKDKKTGKDKIASTSWKAIWKGSLFNHHKGFTPELMAEEMEFCRADKKAEWSKGTLREWGNEMGKLTLTLLEGMEPNTQIPLKQINLFDTPQEDCLAKAGWRLAALLNNIYK